MFVISSFEWLEENMSNEALVGLNNSLAVYMTLLSEGPVLLNISPQVATCLYT